MGEGGGGGRHLLKHVVTSTLQQAKAHVAQELQVLARAFHHDSVPKSITQHAPHLRSGGDHDLVPLCACTHHSNTSNPHTLSIDPFDGEDPVPLCACMQLREVLDGA